MIAADAQFRQTANAAAAAFANSPPYLAYRTEVVVDVPSLRRHQVISRQVETRTKDDFAALQDLPRGQHQYAHSFPLIPTFDALSYFRVTFTGNRRDLLSYVEPGQPITFTDPRATSTPPSSSRRCAITAHRTPTTRTTASRTSRWRRYRR